VVKKLGIGRSLLFCLLLHHSGLLLLYHSAILYLMRNRLAGHILALYCVDVVLCMLVFW
jgi:hypothetical protein